MKFGIRSWEFCMGGTPNSFFMLRKKNNNGKLNK